MNKTNKRQLNVRNKLMAAIAMLLVSSIMMVSTTYAWFTLSTAPEVQGITTTVGANGNLEIALAPLTGKAEDITSGMGDSGLTWLEKNVTWGNLLNMEDSSYGLEQINLLPSRLNFASGTNQSDAVLGMNPLSTPVYGVDGRVSSLTSNTAIGSKYELKDGQIVEAQTYMVNNFRGVRAVGTSSSMSEQEITFNNSMAKMATAWSNAQSSAKTSLTANGAVLAEMAIKHANAAEPDDNPYIQYVPTLNNVVTKLEEANDYLEVAIKYALLAAASSDVSTEEAYLVAVGLITEDAPLSEIKQDSNVSAILNNPVFPAIGNAVTAWENIGSQLSVARASLNDLQGASTASWAQVSGVMNNLMNTANVTINGKNLTAMKALLQDYMSDSPSDEALNFVSSMMSNVEVQLGTGSGIYALLGEVIGDISAPVKIAEISYGTIKLRDVPATISTMTEPNLGSYLAQINVALASQGAMEVEASSNVIDVTYAYVVDFFFRTNATGSSLKLQTEAAQRVYSDSDSTATMGNGSTMTFRSGVIDGQGVTGLMECVRVVFMDPETKDIFGIGKLDMENVQSTLIEKATGANGLANDVYDITAPLYLYNYTVSNGIITFGDKLDGDDNTETAPVLTELAANTAAAVSVLVYLDGDKVDNADVANAESSMTGALNLQFASTANLVPMENTALKNAVEATQYTLTVQFDDGEVYRTAKVEEKTKINYGADQFTGYTIVSATMGGETLDVSNGISIPSVSGDITIVVRANEAQPETEATEASTETSGS